MEPIIAMDRYEATDAFLARTICVLCDEDARICECAPLVLEYGGSPVSCLAVQALLSRYLASGEGFKQMCDNAPEMDMPWYYGNLVAHIPREDDLVVTAYLQPWNIPVVNLWSKE